MSFFFFFPSVTRLFQKALLRTGFVSNRNYTSSSSDKDRMEEQAIWGTKHQLLIDKKWKKKKTCYLLYQRKETPQHQPQ